MRQDGGSIVYEAVIDSSKLKGGLNNAESQMSGAGEKGAKGFGAKFGAIAGITSAVTTKALTTVTRSVGDAIKRVDTLNNSTRVFANMGFSAEEADHMMQNLNESITGLPTSLDSAISNVQLLAGATGDLDKSQQIFEALNNGILGFGGSAEMVDNAMIQLSQSFSNGRVDAQTWNSMINSGLGPSLNALAKEMGITTGELKSGLSEGSISVEEFQDSLIKLNKEGGGGMASLQDIVKDSTAGIGTGVANMQTAVSRGLANIIDAIGQENISNAIGAIGKGFETVLGAIVPVIEFIGRNKDIFAPIAVALGAIVGAMTLWNIAVGIATTVQTIYNAVLAANPLGIILLALIGVTAALIYFFTKTETGKAIFEKFGKFVSKVWEAITKVISVLWNWLKDNWPLLLGILLGPIGIAVVMIIKHWDTIKDAFKAAWEFIKRVWSAVSGWFKNIWDSIKKTFSTVSSWFGNMFRNAWNAIKSAFSSVGGFFQGLWNRITGIFKGIGSTIANAIGGTVKGVVNGFLSGAENLVNNFVSLLNNAIGVINKIPGVSIGTVSSFSLPRLAKGGIVNSPTTALIGEAGREAVLPLENNTGWMDELAKKVGGGGPTTVVVKIGEETIATKVIDLINDKTRLSGTNSILV